MDEQKLNEKLAKWAGIGIDEFIMYKKEYNFTQSLDSCFEWLVPKLIYCSLVKMESDYHGNHWICEVRLEMKGERYYGDSLAKEPALALCLAIFKLIDAEVKDA